MGVWEMRPNPQADETLMHRNREELLFQLALSKPAAKRATWLDAECEGDAALRARLEALLTAHDQP